MQQPTVHRERLANGLRLVVGRVPFASVVGVAVHYGVGFRSEPRGSSGFAHLFEHLMFQGSENVARSDHYRLVQAAGGSANGSTHPDHTDYYQVVPPEAVERVLFLEADRMRAPQLGDAALRTQLGVVKEEIRMQVTGRPYGGFPWTSLPRLLFQRHENAHDGYGDPADLDAVTVESCQDFFRTYYAPGNAVLTVCGAVEPAEVLDQVGRYFGDVPARPGPPPVPAEPAMTVGVEGVHVDRLAPAPALALGYRAPDARLDLPAYLAHWVLADLLTGPTHGRLHRRFETDGRRVEISSGCGFFGPLTARDPDVFLCTAIHPQESDRAVLDAWDAELEEVARSGIDEVERDTVTSAVAGRWAQGLDSLAVRTRALGAAEILQGRAELPLELATRLRSVPAAAVAAAAASLRDSPRALLRLRPAAPPAAPAAPPLTPAAVPAVAG
jgi:zinc protease